MAAFPIHALLESLPHGAKASAPRKVYATFLRVGSPSCDMEPSPSSRAMATEQSPKPKPAGGTVSAAACTDKSGGAEWRGFFDRRRGEIK